jgi:hypothetical protein
MYVIRVYSNKLHRTNVSLVIIVCFYCFDQDKTGYFSVDDLNNLMNVVHNVDRGKTVTGNVKGSWMKLTFKNDQLDFKEFMKIHNAFPRLFGPAFRLQQLMMIHTMGEVWWTFRKRALQDQKDDAALKMKQLQQKKEDRAQAKKNKKIKKNMGLVKYYLCPWWRVFYDPSATAYDKMTAEQKKEADRQMKIARRQAELRMKNPETPYWKKYEEKIALELAELEAEKKVEVIEESKEPEKKGVKKGEKGAAATPAKTSAVDTTVVAVAPAQEEKKIGLAVFEKYDAQVEQNRSPNNQLTSTKPASPEAPKPKGYLEEKIEGTSRMREDRAIGRAERRQQRQRNVASIGKYEI